MLDLEHAQHPGVLGRPGRRGPSPPRVIPARRDVQDPTEPPHAIGGLLRVDEAKSHSLCLAKKAVAFFRISRSSRSSRFSRRSRSNSSRSLSFSVELPGRSARFIHSRSVQTLTPKSRAIVVTGVVVVRASRTASARNSGG